MGYYYNLDMEEKGVKTTPEIQDKAKRLLSDGFVSKISNVNKTSITGGVGLGTVGYIFSRIKGKNTFLFTVSGLIVGFVLSNIIFKASKNKTAKDIVEKARQENENRKFAKITPKKPKPQPKVNNNIQLNSVPIIK